jgi:hypothetical protein
LGPRHQAFLDAYDDLDWIYCKDFCRRPEPMLRQLCDALCIPCDVSVLERFASMKLSGNGVRSSDRIEPRPRRPLPEAVRAVLAEPTTTQALRQLWRRMGYSASQG